LCSSHIAAENSHIHAAMEARRPDSAAHTADDHLDHEHAIARLEDAAREVEASHGALRADALLALYRRLALFVAENLVHMQVEETENNAVLWAEYSDAEIDAVHDAILASLAPEKKAAFMRSLGCEREAKSAAETLALEPALAGAPVRIAGAIYTPTDESGDARKFTQALARLAAGRGVQFRFGVTVRRLEAAGGRVTAAVLARAGGTEERVSADAYVVALGSYSPLVLRTVGVRVPIYPLKGYSITVPLTAGEVAPRVSLTDEAAKLVFSRLGERLRVAGTAELAGYDTAVNRVRCEAIVRRTRELFPGLRGTDRAEFWAGLRPATPSNVPLVGRSRYPNLFLDTGHGTLGWTLAAGSGRAIADIVSGRRPEADFAFLGAGR
ncbi:MAG: FAD-dependent oxidoreductase, partial [Burkholderiales bacterium]|nr:FAD-dependent oxidoreductase [Burkholderiales bacterium]